MTLTALELCAGAGGQALGFERAGFEHEALIDNDGHACVTLRTNRPHWNVIEADLSRFEVRYWHGVDVVAAGLPCPPFSVAGNQDGAGDDRDLFPVLLRIVSETAPRAVVVENVRGLMSRRFDTYRQMVQARLEAAGFVVHWGVLDAHDYGTPQHRTRSFLVAVPVGAVFEWPTPDAAGGGTVAGAIKDLMGARGWHGVDAWAAGAQEPAPTIVGGSRRHGGPDLGPTRARETWAKLGVDGRGMADHAPGPDFCGIPRLTVEMAARLQSFDDGWRFVGGKTQRYRQIGNALPPSLAAAVATAVAQCLNG
ncbi:DNA cytosine methyltransferase [Candidatus Poriferisodalis sp.]|uniref:DNA cytosine methyltransferase n=1 Tax=Candidatus Poriferisodalis sp. TaxID=3101277 RepID=UPI003C702B87